MVLHKGNDLNPNDDNKNFEMIRCIVADYIDEYLENCLLNFFLFFR